MAASVAVEMGDMWVSGASDERLTASGMGACVGLCLYDPTVSLGAMAHIVLPETPDPLPLFRGQPLALRPGKCADTAVAFLLAEIVERGARVRHLRAAMAGGAHIFSHSSLSHSHPAHMAPAPPPLSRLEIGPRNAEAVREALRREGIPLVMEDVGGTFGRTVALCIRTGDFWVQRMGGAEQKLATLGLGCIAAPPVREAAYGR